MALCKYCGEELPYGEPEYCDIVCKNMARYVRGELKLPKRRIKHTDKFSLYCAAQRQAKRNGEHLTYGKWQAEKYLKERKENDGYHEDGKKP